MWHLYFGHLCQLNLPIVGGREFFSIIHLHLKARHNCLYIHNTCIWLRVYVRYQKSLDGTMQPATMLLVLFFTQTNTYCGNKMQHKLFQVNIAQANNRCNNICDISVCFILIGKRVIRSLRQLIFSQDVLVQISTKKLSWLLLYLKDEVCCNLYKKSIQHGVMAARNLGRFKTNSVAHDCGASHKILSETD